MEEPKERTSVVVNPFRGPDGRGWAPGQAKGYQNVIVAQMWLLLAPGGQAMAQQPPVSLRVLLWGMVKGRLPHTANVVSSDAADAY